MFGSPTWIPVASWMSWAVCLRTPRARCWSASPPNVVRSFAPAVRGVANISSSSYTKPCRMMPSPESPPRAWDLRAQTAPTMSSASARKSRALQQASLTHSMARFPLSATLLCARAAFLASLQPAIAELLIVPLQPFCQHMYAK